MVKSNNRKNDNGIISDESKNSEVDNKDELISFSELRQHNGPFDAWTLVNDKVLDITEFAKHHPGGEIILLSAGKDATILFHSYHPRGHALPNAVMKKLQIGTIRPDPIIHNSYYNWESPFYSTLRTRVVKHLTSINRPIRGNTDVQIKAVLILACFWILLFKMCTASSLTFGLIWSVIMGFVTHLIGTCIMHDGNHGAFSTSRLLNTAAGWTMDMAGFSAFAWQIQHVLGHHPYTNLLDAREDDIRRGEGANSDSNMKGKEYAPISMEVQDQESDPDVFSSYPFMTMNPFHEPKWFHKYQHLYAPVLLALVTMTKIFVSDVEIMTSHHLYHINAECVCGSTMNMIRFWSMKVMSFCYIVGLPCYYQGIQNGIIMFVVSHLVCGESLAIMFLVNHMIEGVAYAQKDLSKNGNQLFSKISTVQGITPMEITMEGALKEHKYKVPLNDWAAVQCQTSVNWSSGSWFWNHLSGGLCHQIEHHLFPSMCHSNYVYIQDIVQQTCKDFGVPYQSEPNLYVALGKSIKHLKTMGSQKILQA